MLSAAAVAPRSDVLASVTYTIIAAQLLFTAIVIYCTWRHLWSATGRLSKLRSRIDRHSIAERFTSGGTSQEERRFERAWSSAYDPKSGAEAIEPTDALSSQALLPLAYNGRLDTAAPGLFTAMGIIGTFAGLWFSFRAVDPAQAEGSIRTLVNGMTLAFVNSLVGVSLSVLWTIGSRSLRHSFDRTCTELAEAAEAKFGRPSGTRQVLALLTDVSTGLAAIREVASRHVDLTRSAMQQGAGQFDVMRTRIDNLLTVQMDSAKSVARGLDNLNTATAASSRDLLDKLAPRLEESFKSLVDMPFDRLNDTVDSFRVTVSEVADRHRAVLNGLDASVAALTSAQGGLEGAFSYTQACIEQFGSTVASLEKESASAIAVVQASASAADSLTKSAESLREASQHQDRLVDALGNTVGGLFTQSDRLGATANTFDAAAKRLEAAARQIEQLSTEAATDSAQVVRAELNAAVAQMAEALKQFGDRSATAFEESSGRVIEAVDGQMSDLTDRLSAELTTLTARLPQHIEEMNHSTREVRAQVVRSVKSLDEASKRLSDATTQSLTAQLKAYDSALAGGVDHFSGTLDLWNGHVAEMAGAAKDFRAALQLARQFAPNAGASDPSTFINVSPVADA